MNNLTFDLRVRFYNKIVEYLVAGRFTVAKTEEILTGRADPVGGMPSCDVGACGVRLAGDRCPAGGPAERVTGHQEATANLIGLPASASVGPDRSGFDGAAVPAHPTASLPSRETLERDARRFLRRLAEPGSFLLVAPIASKGAVFCKANDFAKPIAMVPAEVSAAFLQEGWIQAGLRSGRSIRYHITADGRSALKRLIAEDVAKRLPPTGFAEMSSPFRGQHELIGERLVIDPATGATRAMRVNLAEDALGWLTRRKGADGKPFLSAAEYEAGERLRQDFEAAQMAPSISQDWRRFLTPGDRLSGTPVHRGAGEGPMAARDRVTRALAALGPGLSDVALRVCCFLEGLEACENRMGWSSRSGKVVLKIALQRLAQHYGIPGADL